MSKKTHVQWLILPMVAFLAGVGGAIPELTEQFPNWKWLWVMLGAGIVPAANQLRAAFERRPRVLEPK